MTVGRRGRLGIALLSSLAWARTGRAAEQPVHVLRFSSVAPDGTAFARELKAFGRDVSVTTHGQVQVKWYLGGIAGDELTVLDRIHRGQLDGAAGAMLCDKLAPSLRVTRVLGLFQSRAESIYVLGRLKPIIDQEFQQSGFTGLGFAGLGGVLVFSREPVRSLADVRHGRYWIWDLDGTGRSQLSELGGQMVPLPIEEAGRAYDEGRHDGFIVTATGALAFQFSARAKYFTDIRTGFLTGCLVLSNRSLDELSIEQQRAVRGAAAKLMVRFEDAGRAQDDALLGGLFAKQGVKPVPVSDAFRTEFFEAARAARDHLGEKLIPHELLGRVLELLADYRAEHSASEGERR